MATLPSSARPFTRFTISLRRSSVSGGKDRRMTTPSLAGLSPRSLLRMAFSMAERFALSNGLMMSMRASGTWNPASCWSGTSEP